MSEEWGDFKVWAPIFTYFVTFSTEGETMKHGLANGPANISAALMIITGGITYVACTYITAPYGRHVEKKGWGVMVPARLSWFFMESPNLWIPLYHYRNGQFHSFSCAKWILLGLFLIHYIHRSILYPFFRVNGKYHQPLPISVPLLAFGYCSWNAVQQVLSLTSGQSYP